MVIALIFLSLLGSFTGAALAIFAELGLVLGIAAYMAGGMMGTVGFFAFAAIRCAVKNTEPQATGAPQISR